MGALADRYGGLADIYLASYQLRDRCGMKPATPGVAVFEGGELVASHSAGVYGREELNEALVLSLFLPGLSEGACLFGD